MDPTGTVVFTTVGRATYGFDVFSINLSASNDTVRSETRLTDGASVNYNAQFLDDNKTVVFISERTGSPRIYLTSPTHAKPDPLPCAPPSSLFHDRPVVRNNTLYFISAHEDPGRLFRSWSALYSRSLNNEENNCSEPIRLTPPDTVDYSPSVSPSGKLVAVASYGTRPWEGEFHELKTEIVVFEAADPGRRQVVSQRGGWPTLSSDSTVFFHRKAYDGWWSVYRVDFEFSGDNEMVEPLRVTPPGVHCFTPAAFPGGEKIAVATRRRGTSYRHIEIFDVKTASFIPVTEQLNLSFHHYNPFVSPDSSSLGYHRFRGDSPVLGEPELTIPHLEPLVSPEKNLHLLRLNGSFPTFSPRGDLIAFNTEVIVKGGLMIVRSNGSKRWTMLNGETAFCNSWSPTEDGVIYTTVGPIFGSNRTTVQIARITFDPSHLTEDREEVTCEVKILTGEDSGNNAFPSCSPDGKSLVFRSGRGGYKNLYVIDAVNGEVDAAGSIRQLTEGPWTDTMPSWSPKGDLIAFSSNRDDPSNPIAFNIYVVGPDGSGLRRIHVSNDVDRERLLHVCFSGDGEWLMFAGNLSGVTAEAVSMPNQFQPYGELYAVRLDGTGLRRVTCNGYENGTPAWHSGGAELDFGRVSLRDVVGCEKLTGQFFEPLWISCDI